MEQVRHGKKYKTDLGVLRAVPAKSTYKDTDGVSRKLCHGCHIYENNLCTAGRDKSCNYGQPYCLGNPGQHVIFVRVKK